MFSKMLKISSKQKKVTSKKFYSYLKGDFASAAVSPSPKMTTTSTSEMLQEQRTNNNEHEH